MVKIQRSNKSVVAVGELKVGQDKSLSCFRASNTHTQKKNSPCFFSEFQPSHDHPTAQNAEMVFKKKKANVWNQPLPPVSAKALKEGEKSYQSPSVKARSQQQMSNHSSCNWCRGKDHFRTTPAAAALTKPYSEGDRNVLGTDLSCHKDSHSAAARHLLKLSRTSVGTQISLGASFICRKGSSSFPSVRSVKQDEHKKGSPDPISGHSGAAAACHATAAHRWGSPELPWPARPLGNAPSRHLEGAEARTGSWARTDRKTRLSWTPRSQPGRSSPPPPTARPTQPWTPPTLGSSSSKTFVSPCPARPAARPVAAQPRSPQAPLSAHVPAKRGGALRYRTHPTGAPPPPALRTRGSHRPPAALLASAPPSALAQPRDASRPPGGRLPPKKGRKRGGAAPPLVALLPSSAAPWWRRGRQREGRGRPGGSLRRGVGGGSGRRMAAQESVYNLLPRLEEKPVKPPRYVGM